MIDGSVDPTACSGVAPRARIAGVDTTAPPTPNIPESNPVASPAANVSSVRHGSDTGRRVSPPRHRGRLRLDCREREATLARTARCRPRTASGTHSEWHTVSGTRSGGPMEERLLRGVYVPLVTPFGSDGLVSLDAVERLCHEYLDAGVAGIVALGTTGESAALDPSERRAVVDVCASVCAERTAQLVVGVGTNNTAKSVAMAIALRDTPAVVAALVVVPYYVRPSEAGVVEHFKAVAAASPVPVVVYNIPARTGRNVGAAG